MLCFEKVLLPKPCPNRGLQYCLYMFLMSMFVFHLFLSSVWEPAFTTTEVVLPSPAFGSSGASIRAAHRRRRLGQWAGLTMLLCLTLTADRSRLSVVECVALQLCISCSVSQLLCRPLVFCTQSYPPSLGCVFQGFEDFIKF